MGLENILLRLCKELGVALPSGNDWHSALIAMFCTPADQPLPQLFDDVSRSDVSRYRRFRHLSTHGYGVTLDWERTAPLACNARRVFTGFFACVQAYLDSLPPQSDDQ
jgi:hypothetical protein